MKEILIIEDDLNIGELVQDYLHLNGYKTTLVHDGEDGLLLGRKNNYQLILVDLMLPGKSGYEIISEIRKCKDTPMIILSAKNEDIDIIRGLNLGADDYVTKPFSPGELVARVNSHIKKYEKYIGKDQLDVLHFGNLEIDLLSHKVLVDGEEIYLTAKEYELLTFLAAHPNQVFTKEHLFDSIWGADDLGEVATVTVHIQKIRKKIERDSSNPQHVETLWGSGYRFNK